MPTCRELDLRFAAHTFGDSPCQQCLAACSALGAHAMFKRVFPEVLQEAQRSLCQEGRDIVAAYLNEQESLIAEARRQILQGLLEARHENKG